MSQNNILNIENLVQQFIFAVGPAVVAEYNNSIVAGVFGEAI